MDVLEICGVALAFAPIFEVIAPRKQKRKKKRVHRWWMRPWIRDRLLQAQENTAFKLQQQLSHVSLVYGAIISVDL